MLVLQAFYKIWVARIETFFDIFRTYSQSFETIKQASSNGKIISTNNKEYIYLWQKNLTTAFSWPPIHNLQKFQLQNTKLENNKAQTVSLFSSYYLTIKELVKVHPVKIVLSKTLNISQYRYLLQIIGYWGMKYTVYHIILAQHYRYLLYDIPDIVDFNVIYHWQISIPYQYFKPSFSYS